ncbi:MAG: UxaA family hydrolase, partial [Alphaproteobacteria bacterium]
MTTNDTLTTRLHAADNVVVARTDILPGTEIPGENLRAVEHIPAGHKIATAPVAPGESLRKYDQIIGFAPEAIAPGDHVHTHNVEMKDFARDYAAGTEARA